MSTTDDLARRVATRLAQNLDPNLPALTEAAIQRRQRGDEPSPSRAAFSLDPATTTAIAGLILSAAQFAYTIWRDSKADREAKKAKAVKNQEAASRAQVKETIVRGLRLKVEAPDLSRAQRDRIFEAVADEIVIREWS